MYLNPPWLLCVSQTCQGGEKLSSLADSIQSSNRPLIGQRIVLDNVNIVLDVATTLMLVVLEYDLGVALLGRYESSSQNVQSQFELIPRSFDGRELDVRP